jgi:hypothetical protein
MKKKIALGVLFLCFLTARFFGQTIAPGNALNGFGGTLGNGTLEVLDDGDGNIHFILTTAGGFSSDDIVIYIAGQSTIPGIAGFQDTSQFGDNGDSNREAVSGYNAYIATRSVATFPPGFQANYALAIQGASSELYQLATGGNNSLVYLKSANGVSEWTNTYTFTIAASDIGISGTGTFRFLATLISTSAYRSNEAIGTISLSASADTSGNPGFSDNVTFNNSYSYTLGTPALSIAGFINDTENGDAAITDGTLTLTDGGPMEASSAFFAKPIDLSHGFWAHFTYCDANQGGSDGVAFVVQNDPRGANALGATGGGLGYGKEQNGSGTPIADSMAIEFNLVSNYNPGVTQNTDGLTGAPWSGGLGGGNGYTNLSPVINLQSGTPVDVDVFCDGSNYMIVKLTQSGSSTLLGYPGTNLPSILGSKTGYVGFTGGAGSVSSVQQISNFSIVGLNPNEPPTITMPLASGSVLVGSTATLTIAATGTQPLQFLWYKDSSLLSAVTGTSVTISDAQLRDGGTYSVSVSNPGGTVSSSGTVTVLTDGASCVAADLPSYMTVPDPSPGKDSLIVIANGWTNNFQPQDESGSWVITTASNIQARLTKNDTVATNWQVEPIDWSESDPDNPGSSHYGNGSYSLSPAVALNNAQYWGVNLGKQWKAQGWKHIHFIAHSAGAELIESAAMTVGTANSIIQETFLDPYFGPTYAGVATYGENATWADDYCVVDITSPWTYGAPEHAFTFDVTATDTTAEQIKRYLGDGIVFESQLTSSHGYPITFYNNSVATMSGSIGFPLSQEAGGWDTALGLGRNSSPVIVAGNPNYNPTIPLFWNRTVNLFGDADALGQGITQAVGGFIMQTIGVPTADVKRSAAAQVAASPSSSGSTWGSFAISGTGAFNLVSFNLSFSGASSGSGVISIYWNGSILGTIDEANALPGTQAYTFPVTQSGNSQGDILTFRLDNFGSAPSIASVTDVKTGFYGYGGPLSLTVSGNPASQINLNLSAGSGGEYLIETSTDMVDWTALSGVSMESGTTVSIPDPDSVNYSQRFYRAVTP